MIYEQLKLTDTDKELLPLITKFTPEELAQSIFNKELESFKANNTYYFRHPEGYIVVTFDSVGYSLDLLDHGYEYLRELGFIEFIALHPVTIETTDN